MPTLAGGVLWVGEETVGDVTKVRLSQWDADLERVSFVGRPHPDPAHEASLRRLVGRGNGNRRRAPAGSFSELVQRGRRVAAR